MHKALIGDVINVDKVRFPVWRQVRVINCVSVVLRRDVDLRCAQVSKAN